MKTLFQLKQISLQIFTRNLTFTSIGLEHYKTYLNELNELNEKITTTTKKLIPGPIFFQLYHASSLSDKMKYKRKMKKNLLSGIYIKNIDEELLPN